VKNNIGDLAVIVAVVMAMSCFLPWVSTSSSVSFGGISGGLNSGGISGTYFGDGKLAFVIAVGAGIMAFRKMKWAATCGVVNIIIALLHIVGWIGATKGASYSMSNSYGHITAEIDIEYGLYVFLLTAIIFTAITVRNLFENEGDKEETTYGQFDIAKETKQCPKCEEQIKLDASICQFCKQAFSEEEVDSQIKYVREHFQSARKSDDLFRRFEERWG
jgi:hypothetical protein